MKIRAILRRTASALVLIPLLAAADQAPTRDLRNDAEAPIVVTGQRLTREQARERAVTFVRQVGVARGEQPASRWTDPVCPRVLGIAQPYSGIVEARMREIAEAVGMRVGRRNCQPNISVSFVGDAVALMQEIDRRSPTRFSQVPHDAREAILNGDAPIRWWYLTETRSPGQMRNAPQALQTETGGQSGGSATSSGQLNAEAMAHYDSSVISTQGARAIIDAAVVIDLDGVEGRSLQAVAAYAAFVAFSEVRPSAPPPTGSILGMFGAEADARGLTDWDMAFLRALYNLPLDRQARRHRGILVRDMVNFQTGG